MKRFLLLLFIFLLASCRESKPVMTMTYEYDATYTEYGLDSLLTVENIPSISDSVWLKNAIVDYESKLYIIQYTFIQNDSTDFVVTVEDNEYNIKKIVLRTTDNL